MKNILVVIFICTLAGCNTAPVEPNYVAGPETLNIYNDGTLEFGDRTLNEEDVIIYPDGFGGERAAVRVDVPLSDNYYFRDSIRVHREDTSFDKSY